MRVKVMLDLNVIVDVLQQREPFFLASAKVCDAVCNGRVEGYVPAHAATTIFYLVRRNATRERSEKAIDWLLGAFNVVPADKSVFLRARNIELEDFEDAVVVASAEKEKCDYIVTRNIDDYRKSSIKAVMPEEFLEIVHAQQEKD